MTTTPSPSITSYALTGSAVGPFATGWRYADAGDIRVWIEVNGAAGAPLTAGADYTVTAADPLVSGGSVSLSPSLTPIGGWSAGTRLILRRRTPRRQAVALPDTEGHKPRATERALDKQMRIAEEDRDDLDRALLLAPGAGGEVAWAPGDGERFITIGADGRPVARTRPDDFDGLNKLNRLGDNADDPAVFKDNLEIVDLAPGPQAVVPGLRMSADFVRSSGVYDPTFEAGQWAGGKVRGGLVLERTFGPEASSPVEVPQPGFLSVVNMDGAGSNTDGVAVMGIVNARQSGDVGFGANFIASNKPGANGCKLVGLEGDVQGTPGTTPGAGCAGAYFNVFNWNIAGAGIQFGAHGGSWGNVIKLGGTNANGAGLSFNGDYEVADTALNLTVGTFTTAAVLFGNGRQKGAAWQGPGVDRARSYVDGAGRWRFVLADAALLVRDKADNTSAMEVSTAGVAIGAAAVLGAAKLNVTADFSLDGVMVGRFASADNYSGVEIYTGRGAAGNAANTGLRVRADSVTGRAINAGGTVNASGADYAEYERKSADLLASGRDVIKGDVVGFDAEGRLTDRWDQAISFQIKSTRPALCGGDEVFDGLPSAPERPIFTPPAYAGAPDPGKTPPQPRVSKERLEAKVALMERTAALVPFVDPAATPAEVEAMLSADPEWAAARATLIAIEADIAEEAARLEAEWAAAVAIRLEDEAAHAEAVAAAQAVFETETLPAWQAAYAGWSAVMDEARAPFDRIAYAGKVPVNIQGATVGQYLVPVEAPGGGITAQAVNAADLTPEQSLIRLGRVRRVLADGRPEIVVSVG
ncbi:hypothetical protein [Brevundimonas vesicularis]|uniref:Uncharacterized protein n=1 Tax=Brevundimonas vesicularis TaxID=41276 RepID=A0A1Z3U557_BREVE|nr:hypothetical protein [Brevundimonas vesicularis]ASE38423.2 hypothetical protein CEP68_02265 [Brevundimonas vesicularis]